eukprot:m.25830 g.25830  ORF g.25830 m.25830 type:complete len:50 (+) comp11629_c0_seq6:67-216(+)
MQNYLLAARLSVRYQHVSYIVPKYTVSMSKARAGQKMVSSTMAVKIVKS